MMMTRNWFDGGTLFLKLNILWTSEHLYIFIVIFLKKNAVTYKEGVTGVKMKGEERIKR